MRGWIPWLLALMLVGCAEEATPPDPSVVPRPAVAQPEVMFAGCDEIYEGACLLGKHDATLTVWADVQRHAELRVTVDGAVVQPVSQGIDGGVRMGVPVGTDAKDIEVTGVDPAWTEPWRLPIARREPSAVMVRAESLRVAGDLAGGVAALQAALPELSGADRLDALRFLAQAQDWQQDVDLGKFERVVELAERLGYARTMVRATAALVTLRTQKGELEAVEPLLERLDRVVAQSPEGQIWALVGRGNLAVMLGDLSEATRLVERSVRLADRLDRRNSVSEGLLMLANWYAELSDWAKVKSCVDRLLHLVEDPNLPCPMQIAALSAVGWAQLRATQAGQSEVWPVPALEWALALAEDGGKCPSPVDETNLRINLALYELQQGAPGVALAWLEPVVEVPEAWVPWLREVRVRAVLALGRDDVQIPSPFLAPQETRLDDRWNAWVRNARALERIGSPQGAADAWMAAEAIVDEAAAALALGGERDHYVEGRLASAVGLVDALVRTGNPRAALCHARLARGRVLRLLDHSAALRRAGPEARATWVAARMRHLRARDALVADAAQDLGFSAAEREHRVERRSAAAEAASVEFAAASQALQLRRTVAGCDELPPVEPGTAQLVFFPADEGWFIFAAHGDEVDVMRTAALPDTVDPLAERLDGVEQIRVVPTGEAWRLSMPKLRLGDGILLDRAPIVYALDIDRRPVPISKHAVVVADPMGDLAHARQEADEVQGALREAGWSVDALRGSQATREGLVTAMAGASLLHYAGHGHSGGDVGWDAALVLHEDQALSVQDILALPAVPASVVLTGCETGVADASVLAGGMSLGRAFVLAGSGAALVTSVTVKDTLAREVGEQVYADVGSPGWDLPSALRRVQLRLRASQPQSDWGAFHVIVP